MTTTLTMTQRIRVYARTNPKIGLDSNTALALCDLAEVGIEAAPVLKDANQALKASMELRKAQRDELVLHRKLEDRFRLAIRIAFGVIAVNATFLIVGILYHV